MGEPICIVCGQPILGSDGVLFGVGCMLHVSCNRRREVFRPSPATPSPGRAPRAPPPAGEPPGAESAPPDSPGAA